MLNKGIYLTMLSNEDEHDMENYQGKVCIFKNKIVVTPY